MAYGANNARTSVGVYALMHSIYASGSVSQFASISLQLRCLGAVAMGLGTLFCGFKLVPVTGETQLPNLHAYSHFNSCMITGRITLYVCCGGHVLS